ncbi:hypothetical protein ABZX38_20920 [Streptomyces longwoodensis]|uniref:hypothetical protein n=1 Tax=Streptomyces longwoodensis TaxID=68231 RepID=UPI0033A90993
MADDRNSEYEVFHHGSWRVVTPFQEWHNERAQGRVPERGKQGREFAGRSGATATLVRQTRRLRGEFIEDEPPEQKQTCGLGPARPIRICMCRRGEHE